MLAPPPPARPIAYKDVNDNGTFDSGTDLNGQGFTFQLRRQGETTVLQTATSNAAGAYSFSNVAPGTYTVTAVQETGWKQTEPAPVGGVVQHRTVVVPFNQATVTIGDFGNHPLSDIGATFTSKAKNPPGLETSSTACCRSPGRCRGTSTSPNSSASRPSCCA